MNPAGKAEHVMWVALAKAAGVHGVRYRTNKGLLAFLEDARTALSTHAPIPAASAELVASARDDRVKRYLANQAAAAEVVSTYPEQTRQRLDAWQTAQSEWFMDTILEIVAEFIAYEDGLAAPPMHAKCTASPDRADILETIENAGSNWKDRGYPSALAEVRDMANVGRALMEALPKGYSYNNCPSEIVADLQNERDEAQDGAATFCINYLARVLGNPDYTAADGSEEWEGDVSGTIFNVLVAADVIDADDHRVATHAHAFLAQHGGAHERPS